MFERFTDRARRVIVLAQEEARLLGHRHIGTEHLVAGLVHEGEGIAGLVLTEAGVSLDGVRKLMTDRVGEGPGSHGHIPFTPRARKVIELTLREALNLGHNYIGTEHLLLAIEREGQGQGMKILEQLGVRNLRQRTIDVVVGRPVQQAQKMYLCRFVLERSEDVSGVSGTGTVAEGVQFSDGTVCLRWVSGEHHSTVIWDDLESVLAIHGHDGRTTVRWLDDDKMQEALEDLAVHGIHADTMPSQTGQDRPVTWWYEYLERADKTVRAIARRGLGRD